MSVTSTMFTGVSSLLANAEGMSVIGNNISNVNTIGFKGSRTLFADTLSTSLAGGSQVGHGVALQKVDNLFTQGSFESTGNVTDLAIQGNSFFAVKDPNVNSPVNQNNSLLTRSGAFRLDNNLNLVNADGYQVLDTQGNPIKFSDNAAAIATINAALTTQCTTPAGVLNTQAAALINPATDFTNAIFAAAGTAFNTQAGTIVTAANAFDPDYTTVGTVLNTQAGIANTAAGALVTAVETPAAVATLGTTYNTQTSTLYGLVDDGTGTGTLIPAGATVTFATNIGSLVGVTPAETAAANAIQAAAQAAQAAAAAADPAATPAGVANATNINAAHAAMDALTSLINSSSATFVTTGAAAELATLNTAVASANTAIDAYATTKSELLAAAAIQTAATAAQTAAAAADATPTVTTIAAAQAALATLTTLTANSSASFTPNSTAYSTFNAALTSANNTVTTAAATALTNGTTAEKAAQAAILAAANAAQTAATAATTTPYSASNVAAAQSKFDALNTLVNNSTFTTSNIITAFNTFKAALTAVNTANALNAPPAEIAKTIAIKEASTAAQAAAITASITPTPVTVAAARAAFENVATLTNNSNLTPTAFVTAYNTFKLTLDPAKAAVDAAMAAASPQIEAVQDQLAAAQGLAFSKITSIDPSGLITYLGKDGTTLNYYNASGQVGIAATNANSVGAQRLAVINVINQGGLEKAGGTLFRAMSESGVPATAFSLAENSANGSSEKVYTNSLEQSNVDMASEFVKMILTQRAYSAGSKIITTSDEMTQEVINLKR